MGSLIHCHSLQSFKQTSVFTVYNRHWLTWP